MNSIFHHLEVTTELTQEERLFRSYNNDKKKKKTAEEARLHEGAWEGRKMGERGMGERRECLSSNAALINKKRKLCCRKQNQSETWWNQTLRVRQGRETAKPKATTRVIADTAAPANGG